MADFALPGSTALASMPQPWSQAERLLRLHTVLDAEHGPDTLMAEALHGVEGVSPVNGAAVGAGQAICGYRFHVSCLSLDAHLELKKLMGQPVLLELLTDASRTELRPFHGHVTHCELTGANGGMARYVLTIEPWLAFLGLTRDSAVFQDMSVFDIVESIFKDYLGKGKLAPAWRLDIADQGSYPKRSLTAQYQESDLQFVQRLLAEEGLYTWFEHAGDAASTSFGSHTLVIADHNGAFKPNAQPTIAFTQPGAVMQRDSMDRWRSGQRWQTHAVEVASWDYRTIHARPVAVIGTAAGKDALPLTSRDIPGAYAYETRSQGERLASNQLRAIEARNKTFTGAGTVRTLAPATTFTLTEHASHDGTGDDSRFVVLRVVHQAHNNLSAAFRQQAHAALGAPTLPADAHDAVPAHHNATPDPERPLYRNRLDAIPATVEYRPAAADLHGVILHPKPTVVGQQSAIVVGPPGTMVHTDRDHRIKVQFHWQRGANSHSRLAHPNEDGHTGAPADDTAGTWVRVMAGMAPTAGANWGGHAVPRVGQEVLVDFLEGDIDRPVVIGVLYNGQGQTDAQANQIGQGAGSATGNAPAWFPGEQEGHAHAAVLSGIKTQALSASQHGGGGYNQLVFDDSPGQSRIGLQQHAEPHQGTAELNLGHLRQQTDNQRLGKTGYGFELKTKHSAALRAGAGLLVTTDARSNASSTQLDSREAQDQLQAAHAQQQSLATTAQQHNAKLKDEPAAEKLPAIAQTQHSIEVLSQTDQGSSGNAGSGGSGTVTAYRAPQLQLSGRAGIAATTPKDALLASGSTSSVTAGHDINLIAQGNSHTLVNNGISLFTYGKASNQRKPNQETGIALHAASGKTSLQSQSDVTKITADKSITVASTTQQVNVTAKDHVLLTAQGAYLKIAGVNIEIHAPGAVTFKGSVKEWTGPASASSAMAMPKGDLKDCSMKRTSAAESGAGKVDLG